MTDDITTETAQTIAVGQLRAFIERIERLEEDAMIQPYMDALGMA